MTTHIILIIAIVVLVYANLIPGDFIADDYIVIVNNSFIKSFHNLHFLFKPRYITDVREAYFDQGAYNIGSGECIYRPVTTLSYFFDYAIFKLKPWGYRLTDVFIHIVNTLLVYILLNILFRQSLLSLFSALLVGMHPINVEALSCAGFRPDTLAFLFSLLSIALYFKFRTVTVRPKYLFLGISLLSFLLAVFSKEIALILPLALVLCDYFWEDLNFRKVTANWRIYSLYFFIAAFHFFIYSFVMAPKCTIYNNPVKSTNVQRMFANISIYIKDIIFPKDLIFIPPTATEVKLAYPQVLLGAIVVLISIYIVLKREKFPKEISFGILWFFLWIFPMLVLMSYFQICMAYRYLSLPIMGFALVISFFLVKIWEGKTRLLRSKTFLCYLLPFASLSYFAIFTISSNLDWRNELRLHLSMVEKYPLSLYAHVELGHVLAKYGNYREAEKELFFAASQLPRNGSTFDSMKIYTNLGFIYMQEARYAEAEHIYLEAIKLFPPIAYFYTALGVCYGKQGLYEKALEQFNRAKEINPGFCPAYIRSGLIYVLMHKYQDAEHEFLDALKAYPDSEEAKIYLKRLKEENWKAK